MYFLLSQPPPTYHMLHKPTRIVDWRWQPNPIREKFAQSKPNKTLGFCAEKANVCFFPKFCAPPKDKLSLSIRRKRLPSKITLIRNEYGYSKNRQASRSSERASRCHAPIPPNLLLAVWPRVRAWGSRLLELWKPRKEGQAEIMRTSLLEDNSIVCDKCKCRTDAVQKRLRTDDTHSVDRCDRCGHNDWVDGLLDGLDSEPVMEFVNKFMSRLTG